MDDTQRAQEIVLALDDLQGHEAVALVRAALARAREEDSAAERKGGAMDEMRAVFGCWALRNLGSEDHTEVRWVNDEVDPLDDEPYLWGPRVDPVDLSLEWLVWQAAIAAERKGGE